ncbi:hypothetical protein BDR04DRAFT_1112549 [Suillus decipiens]|nr:hypothetical protein BDR04DRAFT_1112549 [Suillus decipiens]
MERPGCTPWTAAWSLSRVGTSITLSKVKFPSGARVGYVGLERNECKAGIFWLGWRSWGQRWWLNILRLFCFLQKTPSLLPVSGGIFASFAIITHLLKNVVVDIYFSIVQLFFNSYSYLNYLSTLTAYSLALLAQAACTERDFCARNVLPHPMQTGKSIGQGRAGGGGLHLEADTQFNWTYMAAK